MDHPGEKVVGQVVQQTTEAKQVISASFVAQRRVLLAQPPEPAEQMGVTAELREAAEVRKGGVEIAEEATGDTSILDYRVVPQSEGESLDVSCEDLIETGFGLAHGIGGVDKRVRFSTARAYSRQTSRGAS
jgi:hypothetical protein